MDPLKVAVIGVGGIAHTHMPGWKASPDAEVVAGADISAQHSRSGQHSMGFRIRQPISKRFCAIQTSTS